MSHKDLLKQLFPIELDGVSDADLEIEGKHLDEAFARLEQLKSEMFPDTAGELLPDWERVYGLTPGADDPLLLRRQKLIAKIREHGSLCKQYYIDLAACLGYTITITELDAGQEGYGDEGIYVWRITVVDDTPMYYFRAGQSRAGDRLLWWPTQTALEGLFADVKPAHTLVIFAYA